MPSNVSCSECNKRHHFLLHNDVFTERASPAMRFKENSSVNKEKSKVETSVKEASIMCTLVCQNPNIKTSCSKTVLVELSMKNSPKRKLIYCIIDEASNSTLFDESLLNFFGIEFPDQSYSMKFASRNFQVQAVGQLVTGLRVRGVLCDEVIDIPDAITCPDLADTSDEVATPEMVGANERISKYANFFPEFNPNAKVLMPIGRNCGRAMATEYLTHVEPYVHRTPLGCTLVGNICPFDRTDFSNEIRVFRTSVSTHEPVTVKYTFDPPTLKNFDVFERYPDDDKIGLSIEDKRFLTVMKSSVAVTPEGNLQLPLPMKFIDLPDNQAAVYARTLTTLNKLKQDESKLKESVRTIAKNFSAGFIEQIPPNEIKTENPTMYLPIFSVDHPRKKKTRLVYDASARYKEISLNDALLSGPDLNNHLRGVLLRFREKPVGFVADIESMFSAFKVPRDQQDILRFFWFSQNNSSRELVPYRSTSHLFGCSSSPAIANFAIKYCASMHSNDPSVAASTKYLRDSFYVDDGIGSADTSAEAADTISGAADILAKYNIRLHKIASNSSEVLDHFPPSELSVSKNKDDGEDTKNHHVLGVSWNLQDDIFWRESPSQSKPFTRRGILSFNNSFYDPIGFIAPILLTGRLLQREFLPRKDQTTDSIEEFGWDDELPDEHRSTWKIWMDSLRSVSEISINRSFYPLEFSPTAQDLHVFCDASDLGIGHVAYMRSVGSDSSVRIAFVSGSSKVSPRSATSIPRLEFVLPLKLQNAVHQSLTTLITNQMTYFFTLIAVLC